MNEHGTASTLLRVRNSERFWTEAGCRLLLSESFALRFRNPRGMLDLAEAGVFSAEGIFRRGGPSAAAEGLLAEATANLGNARKVCGDYLGAERALRASARHEGNAGEGRSGLEARRLEFLGSLRCRQGRFSEARKTLGRALVAQGCRKNAAAEAGVLIQLALVETEDHKPAAALGILSKANRMTSVFGEPLLAVASRHATVKCFLGLDLVDRARCAFERLAPLYLLADDPGVELRGRWVEAEIWAAAGEVAASAMYRDLFDSYNRVGSLYESAKVGLELCILHADRGRFSEVEEAAALLPPLFLALGIAREERVALLLREALLARERAAVLLRSAARVLDREPIGGRARR